MTPQKRDRSSGDGDERRNRVRKTERSSSGRVNTALLGLFKALSISLHAHTHTRTNAELQGRAEAEWESQKG